MAAQQTNHFFLSAILLLSIAVVSSKAALDAHYYDQTCPQAEFLIAQTVRNASIYDPKVPARILRMFFHDCFIRNKAEKDGPPNISVRAFYVIDDAKAKLEKACPQTVSCADIIAVAARDVVAMAGGPRWDVLKGRKDGKVSKANDTKTLPPPTFNVTQLIQSFANRGLDVNDLVTLSGGHTLGFSHCSSFVARLHNFTTFQKTDPSMNMGFASMLKQKCPNSNNNGDAGQFLDSTASQFDNDYYKQLIAGKGVFATDQGMYNDQRTRSMIEAFANDQDLFFKEFAASMIKLGNVGVNEAGEVRLDCRKLN
ncbi:Peroxidase 66 [Bienertia sinuspersici]